jgi:MoxR-like ATPase
MTVLTTPTAVLDATFAKWDKQLSHRFDVTSIGVTATPSAEAVASKFEADVAAEQKTYTRPNGDVYIPREFSIDGARIQDVTFIKLAAKNKMPVLLYGDPGTGKTAMIEAALDNLVTIQGTIETETSDFVGSWTQQTDGTYRWVDGPLAVAMENGWPFLIDEVALIDPRVMAVVYGVMDGRDELVVTANPERGTIKMTDGFMVFGACNPDVPGAVMSDALLSRFQFHVEVTTDWALTKKLKISAKIVQVARNLNIKKTEHLVTAAPQLRELLTYQKVCDLFGEDLALRNFVSQCRPEDRPTVLEAIESVFGTKPKTFTL